MIKIPNYKVTQPKSSTRVTEYTTMLIRRGKKIYMFPVPARVTFGRRVNIFFYFSIVFFSIHAFRFSF